MSWGEKAFFFVAVWLVRTKPKLVLIFGMGATIKT
jgi:hypothetical protein